MGESTLSKILLDSLKERYFRADPSLLVEHARRNKILLHFLRTLNIKSFNRYREERRYNSIISVLQIIAKALNGLNYSLFKFFRPVVYVPADIDLLVSRSDLGRVLNSLRKLGFRVVVKDPYCVTLVRGRYIVDVYTDLTFIGVILVDGSELLKHVYTINVNGVSVNTLKPYAEALVVTVHSVLKEGIFTLNDYLTLKDWITQKTIMMAWKLKCTSTVNYALKLLRRVELGLIETPYKIPFPTWIKLLTSKFISDSKTRVTSLNTVRFLANPKLGKLILSRFTRETY